MTPYELITARILQEIERGTVPWRQPWTSAAPRNLFSRRRYRGVNVFCLATAGFRSAFWATADQIVAHGGRIKPDQCDKHQWALFWRPNLLTTWNERGELGTLFSACWGAYHVYNLEQTEGLHRRAPPPPPIPAGEAAERLVAGMPRPPKIEHNTLQAFYSPLLDRVSVPWLNQFVSPEEYHCTLFHELVHATGHQSRLGRSSIAVLARRNSHDYSLEELIAEMGAAMLCGLAGLAPATIQNSASYIASWLEVLRGNKAMLIRAAAKAQSACDFILGQGAKASGSPGGPTARLSQRSELGLTFRRCGSPRRWTRPGA